MSVDTCAASFQLLEESLWREETRFDRPYMEQVMADDFVEYGRSGQIYDRSSVLAVSCSPIEVVMPLPDFRVRLLSDHVAQVTYDSHVVADGVVLSAHRSSIWSLEPDGWKLRFHQATPYVSAVSATDATG